MLTEPVANGDDRMRGLWYELLPTAYLLCAGGHRAQHLLAAALSDAGVEDRDSTVRAMVHRLLRSPAGEAHLRSVVAHQWWLSEDDIMAASRLDRLWAELTRPERSAVVLHYCEGWPLDLISQALPGIHLDNVTERLGAEVPRPAQLPARLNQLAAVYEPEEHDDPLPLVRDVLRQRRRSTANKVAVVTALAVGLFINPPVAAPDRATLFIPAPPVLPAPGIFAGPARGNLAGDLGLVAQLEQRANRENQPGVPYQFIYGSDSSTNRVALVARTQDGDTDLSWFTGPPAADVASLTMSSLRDATPDATRAAGIAVPEPNTGNTHVVVITQLDMNVAVMPWLTIDPATGTSSRARFDAQSIDGAATLTLPRLVGLTPGFDLQYMVSPPGVPPADPRHLMVPLAGSLRPSPAIAPQSSRSGSAASVYGYARAVETIASATGYVADDLQLTVLGAGLVPQPDGGPAEVISIAAVLPNGAVVVTTGIHRQDGGTGNVSRTWQGCGSRTYPVSTDPLTITSAASCPAVTGDDAATTSVTVVSAPPGTAVSLVDSHSMPTPVALQNGWGYLADPPTASFTSAVTGTALFGIASATSDDLNR